MSTKFVNRAKHLVILKLNSGTTVHLAPGEVSQALENFETDDNSQLDKLRSTGVIEAVPGEDAGTG